MKILSRLAYPALSLLFIWLMSLISELSVGELSGIYALGAVFVLKDYICQNIMQKGKL